jgi:hypothetical protein
VRTIRKRHGWSYFGFVSFQITAHRFTGAAKILLTSMASCASNQPQRRLGTRVRAQIPVRITSLNPADNFSQTCHTVMVNPKGCGIRCPRPLTEGVQLRIEDLPGRGSTLARVACTRPMEDGSNYWIVGIALESPGNLWCMAPVPPDWGTYSAPPKFFPMSVKYIGEDSLITEVRAAKA